MKTALLITALLLTGCTAAESRAYWAGNPIDLIKSQCAEIGYEPGTPSHTQCTERLLNARASAEKTSVLVQ
jgi:hypothetical protein